MDESTPAYDNLLTAVATIGGRWTGAIPGAELGAYIGALTGPAAPITIPALSLIGGVGGALGMEKIANWVIDISYVGG